MSDRDDVAGCLAPLLAAGVSIALAPWWAFVTSVLWGWFVAGTFGLPALGWAEAYGLRLVLVMLVGGRVPRNDDPVEAAIMALLAAVVYPAVALLAGWITLAFV